MTRLELLRHLVQRASAHGFEFQAWYQKNIEPRWDGVDEALEVLDHGRRYYALLFSHDFAANFWKKGTQIVFLLPSREYQRVDKKGNVMTVQRQSFTRRSSRSTSNKVWQYHLEQMTLWEEPLRYIRRFILTEEDEKNAGVKARPKPRRGLMRRPIDWC